MILYSFDASAMIYLWDNYPIQNPNFDSMWQWFFGQVAQENFVISDVAIKEVKQKILYSKLEKDIPESAVFIKILNTIIVHKKTPEDLKTVQTIKSTLKIEGEAYGKGVGENDLLIIANAKRQGAVLVTNEARQADLSQKQPRNYKIPAVCKLDGVNVEAINLTELLKLKILW